VLKAKLDPGNGYQIAKTLDKFINATFVWWVDSKKTKPYPLTPLVSEGELLSDNVYINDDGDPMPLFIIYTDGTCGIEITRNLSSRKDIRLAVGGIALFPKIDFSGFKKSNINSLTYPTKRIAIAYNEHTNKVCLIACDENIDIYDFLARLIPFGFSLILGLDSGGSAQWVFNESKRLTGRYMIGWLYW